MNQVNTLQERLQRLQQFQKSDPANSQILQDIGRTHLQLHQYREALSAFDAALVIRPEAAYVFDKATTYLAMEHYPQARDLLTQLLDQGIDNPGIRFNLAYASIYLGDSAASAEHLKHLSQEDIRQIPNAGIIIARTQHFNGELDQAAQTLQAYLSAQPDDAFAIGMLALVAADHEDYAAAKALAKEALQQYPGCVDALLALGQAEMVNYRIDDAAEYYDQAVSLYPACGRAWLGKGLAAMSNFQLDVAERCLKNALEYIPEHLGTWNTLAWAQLFQNKLAEAEDTLRQSLEIDRNFGDSYGTLATILWVQGRKHEAEQYLKLGKKLDPDSFACSFVDFLKINEQGEILAATAFLKSVYQRPIKGSRDNLTLEQGIQRLIKNRQKTTTKVM